MSSSENRFWRIEHHIAAVAALVVFMLVYLATGDADLFYAVGSGLGACLAFYFSVRWYRLLHEQGPQPPKTDGRPGE